MKRRLFWTQENKYGSFAPPQGSQGIVSEIITKNQSSKNAILCFVIDIGTILANDPTYKEELARSGTRWRMVACPRREVRQQLSPQGIKIM